MSVVCTTISGESPIFTTEYIITVRSVALGYKVLCTYCPPYPLYCSDCFHYLDLQVQEDYIKDELKNLRTEYLYAQEEVKRIQSVPLVIGQFLEAVDQNYAIVGELTLVHVHVHVPVADACFQLGSCND